MTASSPVKLRATCVRFLSARDEAAFFDWAAKLHFVKSVVGKLDHIDFEVAPTPLSDENLRELIALFTRYRIDLRQLLIFETPRNKGWLSDRRAYWHADMYAKKTVA